jgi:hypothetical protein
LDLFQVLSFLALAFLALAILALAFLVLAFPGVNHSVATLPGTSSSFLSIELHLL